ncbi:hypothetical protein GCM10010124_25030 [Pilimelia terevasa]|uniref:VCBS repeat-containing protein n=1 Tax=Pilimelia terevasa TaxID=53372 RepID=A0A8J3FI52_9ACTN|nr:VCBS repeat-containing protein [Pilimelia terevasa]GGK31213.1 hypothetical protein GCM10010124_25030 [Pilimelia terevasa]
MNGASWTGWVAAGRPRRSDRAFHLRRVRWLSRHLVSTLVVAGVAGGLGAPASARQPTPRHIVPVAVARPASSVPPATTEEKLKAATAVGLDPAQVAQLDDREFTFRVWQKAPVGSEVSAAAVLALNDEIDPDTKQSVACSLYIRTGITEAKDRDANQEIRDRNAAAAATARRQSAADLVGLPGSSGRIGLGDRDFIIVLWEYVRQQQPGLTGTIAAAEKAFAGGMTDRETFLGGGLGAVYAADRRRLIDEAHQGDEAARKDAERRFARQFAASAVGVAVTIDDPQWMGIREDDFLRRLGDIIGTDPLFVLTEAARAKAVMQGQAASLSFIEKGIHERVADDGLRRREGIRAEYRRSVSDVRGRAERDGYKNLARAAQRALADGTLQAMIWFLQSYTALPLDSSDVALFQAHDSAPNGKGVTGWALRHLGRSSATVQRFWTSSTWIHSRFGAAAGDFDRDGRKDVAVLYRVATYHYRIFLFSHIDSGDSRPVLAWETKSEKKGWEFGYHQLVAGDYNGDGLTDLAVQGSRWADNGPIDKSNHLYLMMSDGKGAFAAKATPFEHEAVTGTPSAGDVDRDGKDDLVFLSRKKLWLAVSSGDGIKQPVVRWSASSEEERLIDRNPLVDIDQDGSPELVVLRQANDSKVEARAFRNLAPAAGNVAVSKLWEAAGVARLYFGQAFAPDVNGDGATDVTFVGPQAVTPDDKPVIHTMRGSRHGGFSAVRRIGNPKEMTWGYYAMVMAG